MTKKIDVTVWHNGKFVEATIDADGTLASEDGIDDESVVISDFTLISHNFETEDQLCAFVGSTTGTAKIEQAVIEACYQ